MQLLTYRVLLGILEHLGGDSAGFPRLEPLGCGFLHDLWEVAVQEYEQRKGGDAGGFIPMRG